ncbi:hypothetical protein ACIQZB_37745 [Streptomyces sp. NPDC097727]|uniref:hypothetical protein n=1 Tax=Streptomyces sp. NPDC097727 TaxID=3366092 RepID=UPI003826FE8B
MNWSLESVAWAAGIAQRKIAAQLGKWGYRLAPAVADGGAAVAWLLAVSGGALSRTARLP